jgi:hypothetical protein
MIHFSVTTPDSARDDSLDPTLLSKLEMTPANTITRSIGRLQPLIPGTRGERAKSMPGLAATETLI